MKTNEKIKKISEWLTSQEGYIPTTKPNICKKYGVGEVELIQKEPQAGKTDFEVQIKDDKVRFYIRIDKFVEREFKKFYKKADEVQRVWKTQGESFLSRLSELGFKDYFEEKAKWLFSEQEDMKAIALKMANKEIDIDDYTEGRSKQIEIALTKGKRFDEIEQSDFANYQEYEDCLKKLRATKDKLVDFQRAVEKDWAELKDRHWYGMWNWLRTDAQEKAVKQALRESRESREEIVNRLAQEYFNSLPKTTQVELEDIIKAVQGEVVDWEKELVTEEKKTWTDEQWKQYLPKEKYSSQHWYKSEWSYNEGRARWLQLVKIIKQPQSNYLEWENKVYQQVVKEQKEFFSAEKLYDRCNHCEEAGSSAPFKLIFKTKHRLFYVCSRCENTEIFFDILEWE